jgi:hypothetical protein
MAQVRLRGRAHTHAEENSTVVVHVVRVRETQEYDVDVATAGDSQEAARLARRKFLGMTVNQQAANSVGVTARRFEAGEDEFDEDELTDEGNR